MPPKCHRWPSWGPLVTIIIGIEVACHPRAAGRQLNEDYATGSSKVRQRGIIWLRGDIPPKAQS